MMTQSDCRPIPSLRRSSLPTRALALGAAVCLLAGCGGGGDKEKAATQTAAKVNKEEITVHQINYVLSQQRGLPPAQAASAGQQVLERLIDQELSLQKAADQKVDRDPRVVQQIEAARRDIVARAYLEKISSGAPKPTPQEVKVYYESHPALFKERRVYNLQELNIEGPPEQMEALRQKLADAKTLGDFVAYLKASDIRFKANEGVRAAEQLPMASIEQLAKFKEGQAIFRLMPTGAQVLNVASVRSQPVNEQQATPAIEQFLLNERKRKLVADDLQSLRTAAKIEYVGEFAANAALAPKPAPAPEAPPLTSIAPPLSASEASAAPQMEVPSGEVSAASMPSGAIMDKGLKGFK